MSQFDYAILGAGAIGSIVGAHLARAGHSVVMLVREQRARHIDQHGLRIQGLAEFTQPVPTLTDYSKLVSARVLIVAMKTHGTQAALESLRGASIGAAFSIQNGLLKNQLLIDAFGEPQVLGALADTSGELLPSGDALFTRNVNLFIGEIGADAQRAQQIAQQIDASGVRSSAVSDIRSREWSKFAGWAGFMILSVTTRLPTWKYLVDPDSALIIARLVAEIATLARACGVELTDEAMLPVATMSRLDERQAVEAIIRAGRNYEINAPAHRMSALQDLDAGRALEVDGTLGYAVRKATALNLRLPLLEAGYHLAASIDRNRA